MGSETKEADIIVYADDECEETCILVECKKKRLPTSNLKFWLTKHTVIVLQKAANTFEQLLK